MVTKYPSQVKWHQRNREAHYRSVRTAKLKAKVKAFAKLGNKCELEDKDCKGTQKWYFEIHHRNFDGHLDPLKKSGQNSMVLQILRMETPLEKYQLLCHEHHKLVHKHRKNNEDTKPNTDKVL